MRACDILLSLDGETLEVQKTSPASVSVCYRNCEIKDGIFLKAVCGRGTSFEAACESYLHEIRGKTLVFDACSNSRREVKVLG